MSFSDIMDMVKDGASLSLVVTIVITTISYLKYKKLSPSFFLFTFYILMLLYVTLYRYGISYNDLLMERPPINIQILYRTYMLYVNGGWTIFLYNILGNVLWFVPFGYYISYRFHKLKLWHVLLLSMCFSTSIEIVQYLLNCGITDIDDVVFNTIGGVIGYCTLRLWKQMVMKYKRK